jgi:preprotein translocase subunit SecG
MLTSLVLALMAGGHSRLRSIIDSMPAPATEAPAPAAPAAPAAPVSQ